MNIKLDENMPESVREFLLAAGCDVETVLGEKLGGKPDPVVVAAAKSEGRVLFTLDKGIANVRSPDLAGHSGLVLIRLKHPSAAAILSLVEKHFPEIQSMEMRGKIAVLSLNGIRIR